MLSNPEIQLAIQNLNLLIAHPNMPAFLFTLNNNELKKNWFFQTQEKDIQKLKIYLQNLIDEVSQDNIDFNKQSNYNLFISLQCFLNLEPNKVLEGLNLDLSKNSYLKRQNIRINRLGHFNPDNQFKAEIQRHLLPEINYDIRTGLYTAPDDDKAHQHGAEAGRIFISTQFERFKAFCNWLFSKFNIHIFETARYKEHDYIDCDIYTHDKAIEPQIDSDRTPGHYWVGHSTSLLTIPTENAPLHVLTDPVEGDLAPFIYPRTTEEASLVDGTENKRLPKIDVIIISHNHHDHLSTETLKRLVKQQPKMVVPEGDELLFINLGFKDVVGLKWWEQATIVNTENKELLRITAVPTRHWSGRSIHDAHRSAFNGYVLHSDYIKGDIYFAGDTALMNDEVIDPVLDRFNIVTSIQPGGPDERHEDLESTHQSSADGILMHFKILASEYKKMKSEQGDGLPSFEKFIEKVKPLKTIYNHTATFKLGNLRLKDTLFSYQRMVAAFQESPQWRADHLPQHELNVYEKIQHLVNEMIFDNGKAIDNQLIVEQILDAVNIPKIGQKQSLYFNEGMDRSETAFQHRNLITNGRALTELDGLLKSYLKSEQEESLDVKSFLLKMLDNYQDPWHASFTRSYRFIESYKKAVTDCQDSESLLVVINKLDSIMQDRNQHGHLQSLIHYAKWFILFTDQHRDRSADKLKEYFVCQEIKKLIDQEIHHTGWVLGGTPRTVKQQAFTVLADQLAKLPEEQGKYQQIITQWLKSKVNEQQSVQQLLNDNRSNFFASAKTRSDIVVDKIQSLLPSYPSGVMS